MNRVATPGYLRYPHVHGDLLTFVTEDDVWLAPAEGGRAWRLTSDGGQASNPRFSPDGATIAWTSWRDGGLPEVYTAELDGGTGGPATRRTYWGDLRTRTTGWTDAGEVLATTAVDQPSSQRTHAYAVPLDGPPRRLPFGQVNDLALTTAATALLTGQRGDPAYWKRYRGGTGGRLWIATGDDPLFTRVLSGLDGQLASPMVIGGRLVFLSDHEGTGNVYSAALDGTDLRRHTDHDGFYARNPATDGARVVYHVAGDIWTLDSLEAEPRKLGIQLTTPPTARAPKLITADDHLGDLDCDKTGQASVVTVRGTVHWLTHDDGPARALLVDPAARARLPRVLGPTGSVAWVTDASGADAIEAAEIDAEHPGTTRTIAAGDLGNVLDLASSPDGAKLAATAADGRLLVIDVESGETTELARNDDGEIEDIAWSPDSAWLAWAQPGPQPLARIRLARIADGSIVDVTDGRFFDSHPVFTTDGLYLAFMSRRTFDPIYDTHSFDLSFPLGDRPYLVPLAAYTLSPFGPQPGGRPVGGGENSKDASPERSPLTVDTDGISSRVVAVPVDEARYYSLAPVKGGLVWLRYPVAGLLGDGAADLEESRPKPVLERFDLKKREASVLTSEVSWFAVSGDGTRLVVGDEHKVRVVPSDRKVDNGSSDDAITVDLSRARFSADPAALWAHAYEEFGRLLRRDFWTPTMSEVDWDGVLDDYRFLLGRIRSSAEFGDLLWEVAAELGTSHAYVMPSSTFTARSTLRGAPAALLGADVARSADGRWLVERVLPGESSDPHARSPFGAPGVAVREGDEILAVDGRPVDPVYGPWPALAGTHGKPVELTIRPADPSLVPWPPTDKDDEDDAADSADEPANKAADAPAPEQPASAATAATPDASATTDDPATPDSWATATAESSAAAATVAPETSEDRRTRRARLPRDPPRRHRPALRRPPAPLPGLGGRPPPVRPRPVRRPGRLPARARHDGRGLGAPAPGPANRDGPRGADHRRPRQPGRPHLAAHRREAGPPDHRLEGPAPAAPLQLPARRPPGPAGRPDRRVRGLRRRHRHRRDPQPRPRPRHRRPDLGRRGRHRRPRPRAGRRHPHHRPEVRDLVQRLRLVGRELRRRSRHRGADHPGRLGRRPRPPARGRRRPGPGDAGGEPARPAPRPGHRPGQAPPAPPAPPVTPAPGVGRHHRLPNDDRGNLFRSGRKARV